MGTIVPPQTTPVGILHSHTPFSPQPFWSRPCVPPKFQPYIRHCKLYNKLTTTKSNGVCADHCVQPWVVGDAACSQWWPVYRGRQTHVYELMPSFSQVPPFWHGVDQQPSDPAWSHAETCMPTTKLNSRTGPQHSASLHSVGGTD